MTNVDIDIALSDLAKKHDLQLTGADLYDDMVYVNFIRRSVCNTQQLKESFLNNLKQIVKDRIDAHWILDYDMLDAPAKEHAEALLKTFGMWKE